MQDALPESTAAPREVGPVPSSPSILRIGEYEIDELLGRGSMGEVYRARHRRLERQVALKLLPRHALSRPDSARRFEEGVRALGRAQHPNIVTAYDAARVGDFWYLAMELVEGPDLGAVLRQLGPIRTADACEMVRQVALGLAYGHQRGIVHRDIKPSNLLLDPSGTVKIADFGLARMLEESRQAEAGTASHEPGSLAGTPAFMPPEQLQGAPPLDPRSDLYSLGATLFTLLHGYSPSSTDSASTELPPNPSPGHQPRLPAGLRHLLRDLLQDDPSRRPATALLVAQRLERWSMDADLLRLLATVRHGPGRPTPAPRPSRSRRAGTGMLWAAIGVVSIPLLAIGGWMWWGNPGPRPLESQVAAQPHSTDTMPPKDSETKAWTVDDAAPGFSTEGTGVGWRSSRLTIGYGRQHHFNEQGAWIARWNFPPLPAGSYRVYATWPVSDESPNAQRVPYVISDGQGHQLVAERDQTLEPQGPELEGVRWELLGTFEVRQGTLTVELDARKSQGPGAVRADAVRAERISP